MNESEIIFSQNAADIRKGLGGIDAEELGRRSGAMQRTCRKLAMGELLHVFVALSAEKLLTLERIAAVVRLHLKGSYSKQALCKRLACGIDRFLILVAAELFGALPTCAALAQGAFEGFGRVLVQDSTTVALPDRFASSFKGSTNSYKANATMKIQLIMDLLNGGIARLSLSGFDRNDQAASGDILEIARRGDLVLRDLGYFVLAGGDGVETVPVCNAFILMMLRLTWTCFLARARVASATLEE